MNILTSKYEILYRNIIKIMKRTNFTSHDLTETQSTDKYQKLPHNCFVAVTKLLKVFDGHAMINLKMRSEACKSLINVQHKQSFLIVVAAKFFS